jgi:predicted membrane protein
VSSDDKFDAGKYSEDLSQKIRGDIDERIRQRWSGRPRRPNNIWPGIILMLVGGAILLDHMGVLPVDRIWRFWPVILILVGAVRFVDCCNKVSSVVLMGVGALFLLGNLGYVHFSWGELWPVILIAAGAAMIWGRMNLPKISNGPSPTGDPNTIQATTIFGGVERRINTQAFKGGTVTATFGGAELDFRSADMEGEEAVLYVEAIFGGIELVIPERWMAICEAQSIFGGYSDETRPPLPEVPGAPPKKRLILRGQALFGGISVKN